jgi:hypothetical protein
LTGQGDFTSIQDALDAAKDGDTVLVKPGEYLVQEPLDFNRGAVWNGTAKKDLIIEEADLHFRPDSPAIDLAPCAGAPDHDRDGAPRPAGASCDAGAYEFQISAPVAFIRGDSNADGRLDVSDPIHALRYLFTGGPAPTCLDAADGDDGGSVDISDGVYLLLYLFTGGKAPPPPGPSCGLDPTPDELSCAGYKACE